MCVWWDAALLFSKTRLMNTLGIKDKAQRGTNCLHRVYLSRDKEIDYQAYLFIYLLPLNRAPPQK